MLSKAIVLSLLNVVQSDEDREEFAASEVLTDFVRDSGIGILSRKKIIFTASHKDRIRTWLQADNIDPDTSPDAWSKSRAEALSLGPDEKWARGSIREDRIAFKALGGRGTCIGDSQLVLPVGANLEWNWQQALQSLRHPDVIVVENWEAFERIDDLMVDMSRVSESPLVIWRGGSANAATGACKRFLADFDRPVWSAPDYDPAGLLIACGLPHLTGVLSPSDEELRRLLNGSRLQKRYSGQLLGAQGVLDGATNADVRRLWTIVRESKNALPQEALCRSASLRVF